MFNFYCSLHCPLKNKSIYVLFLSMQANKNINLWQEKAPVTRLSRSKSTQNRANLPLHTCEKKLNVSVFQLKEHGTVVGLLRFSPYFLFACATSLACKTTIIKDTHLTLMGILSKVEANNSLIFAITNIQEKICRVSVPVHNYNSLYNLNSLCGVA